MNADNDKLIRRYLDNEMTKQEKEQFKNQLSNNQQLKEDLQTQLLLDAAKVELQKEDFKRYDIEIKREKTIRISIIVGLIIVILFAISYFIFNQKKDEYDGIYATYLEEAASSELVINDGIVNRNVAASIDDNYELILEKAINHYDKQNYQIAKEQFTDILENHPFVLEVLLYRGICDYELKNYTTALSDFVAVDNGSSFNKNLELKETAIWYQGFTQLRLHDKAAAITAFERIEVSTEYGVSVKKILEKLNSN